MDWKQYEKEIFEYFSSEYPDADIKHNVMLVGRYSKVQRQIDILIEEYVAGNKFQIVIDAKYFSKNIDVKDVESFISMLADIGAHKGLLITKNGYSQAAINRAFNDPNDIELDILNFDELKRFQAFGAITYAGENGVLLPAPFGWILDYRASDAWLALLYQRGLNLEEAQKKDEWMYINLWDRKANNDKLEDLMSTQEMNLLESDKDVRWEYNDTIKRTDARTKIRIANYKKYNPEITGFVEFQDFIFFCVLFTPKELVLKNIRKVENILKNIRQVKINNLTKNYVQQKV